MLKRRKPRSIFFHLFIVGGFAWLVHEYMVIEYIFAWFFAVNVIAFAAFARDKLASKVGALGRTPEITFHTLGILGGFPGIIAGRKVLNHKTSKTSFVLPMWLLFIVQISIAAWYYGNLGELYHRWEHDLTPQNHQKTRQQPQQQAEQPDGSAETENQR